MNNRLKEDLNEFIKEKEEIREIIGKIGGNDDNQYKLISTLFFCIITVILVVGIILKKISPTTTFLIALLVAIFKIIWMLQQTHKSMHFQFWILNSLEIRLNEIDKRQKKFEKILDELSKK